MFISLILDKKLLTPKQKNNSNYDSEIHNVSVPKRKHISYICYIYVIYGLKN